MKFFIKNILKIWWWILFIIFFGVPSANAEIFSVRTENEWIKIEQNNLIFDSEKNTISGKFFSKTIGETMTIPLTNGEMRFGRMVFRMRMPSKIIGEISGIISINTENRNATISLMWNLGKETYNAELFNDDEFLEKSDNFLANHKSTLEVKNAKEGRFYDLKVEYLWMGLRKMEGRLYSANGTTFENVDLSLAGTYALTLTVKNMENNEIIKTITHNITVLQNEIKKDIVNEDFFAKQYCQTYASSATCPDGNVRKWSEISANKSVFFPQETATMTVRLRDQYGNRIHSGSVLMELQNDSYLDETARNKEPALKINGNSDLSIILTPRPSQFNTNDYDFKMSSMTTNNSDTIQISKLLYNNRDILDEVAVNIPDFLSWVQFRADIPKTMKNNQEQKIEITTTMPNETKEKWLDGNENFRIFGRFFLNTNNDIDDGSIEIVDNPWCRKQLYGPMESSDAVECTWGAQVEKFSEFGFAVPKTPWESQTIVKILPSIFDEESETVSGRLEWYLQYRVANGQHAFYKIRTDTFTIENSLVEEEEKIEKKTKETTNSAARAAMVMRGTSGNLTGKSFVQQNGILSSDGKNRAYFFNAIEKNIAYLNRNSRNSFSQKKYEIREWNQEIWDDFFETKRSLIVLGGDVTIRANISQRNEPTAIIALSRKNKGGNIIINGDVTNVNTALIAEKSILGDENLKNQLAIFGAISAENSCDGAQKNGCFSQIRKDFSPDDAEKSKKADGINMPNGVVLMPDFAIHINPPPGLENFIE